MTHTVGNTVNEVPKRVVTGRVDLYREIHKGLRHVLFDVTLRAGRVDPDDDGQVLDLVGETRGVVGLLAAHHDYEEQPDFAELVAAHAPAAAGSVDEDHRVLAERLDWLASRADELAAAPPAARAVIAHAHYLELAAFTGAYLAHLDVEERVVMPALAAACDDAELGSTRAVALATVPPDIRATALAEMLPALAPAERIALVSEVLAGAPPEAVVGVRAIAAQVLSEAEYDGLESTLGGA
jgi:hypothetical protein